MPVENADRKTEDPRLAGLVRAAASGDEGALAALYAETVSQIFGLAVRIVRDRGTAEEVTMEVYLQVWRQASRYEPRRGSVRAWLLLLARSRAIDALRSRTSISKREEQTAKLVEFPDPRPSPEVASIDTQIAGRVRGALQGLPVEQQRAIEAAFFGGLTHSEVATTLGEPLGTVKTRIRRGLATLRRELDDMGGAVA